MLPDKNRLKKKDFFVLRKTKGKSFFSSENFKITLCGPEPLSPPRFGVVISAAVSKKAVLRNKLKRRVRAILSQNISRFPAGVSVVIYPQKSALSLSYKKIEEELSRILKEINRRKIHSK